MSRCGANLWNYFLPNSRAAAETVSAKPSKKKLKDAVQFEVTTARFDVHQPYKSPWPLTLTAVFLLAFVGYTGYRAWPAKSMVTPIDNDSKEQSSEQFLITEQSIANDSPKASAGEMTQQKIRVTADKPDLRGFGELPAVFKGRVKPLDTLARNSLALISRGETFVDENGVRQPAIKWLLDLWADPETFKHHKIFYIENPELLKKLGLERRPKHLYSYRELTRPAVEKALEQLVATARGKDQLKLDVLDKRAIELSVRMRVANELRASDQGPQVTQLIPSEDLRPEDIRSRSEAVKSPTLFAIRPAR